MTRVAGPTQIMIPGCDFCMDWERARLQLTPQQEGERDGSMP